MDIDHPVNVVEGDDCIVLQVRDLSSTRPPLHFRPADSSFDLCLHRSIRTQLNSHGKLTDGRDWPMEYVFILRFDAEHKITCVDFWNVSPRLSPPSPHGSRRLTQAFHVIV